MSKLNFNMSTVEMLIALCEGNPGGLSVLRQILDYIPSPHDMNEKYLSKNTRFDYLCLLDEIGIYGSDIWVLYKDICDQDLDKMLFLLLAYDRNVIRKKDLTSAMTQERSDAKTNLRKNSDNIIKSVKELYNNG